MSLLNVLIRIGLDQLVDWESASLPEINEMRDELRTQVLGKEPRFCLEDMEQSRAYL